MSMCILFFGLVFVDNRKTTLKGKLKLYLNVLLHLNGLKPCESDMRCRLGGELLIGRLDLLKP